MLKYLVYKHTFPNGKIYIGITSRTLEKRIHSGYYHNLRLHRAIQKYGWPQIKSEILYVNLTEEQAKQKEIALIKVHNSINPAIGYNLSTGGESHKRCIFKHSDEAKRKISEHNAKYWEGKKRPKLKKEHAQKLTTSRNISVRCIETGQIFTSITEAMKMTGATHINDCLKGKFHQSGGFHWELIGGEGHS